MTEGGKQPKPFKYSFSKASGDADELLCQASGDAEELLCQASGDAEELLYQASGDADELLIQNDEFKSIDTKVKQLQNTLVEIGGKSDNNSKCLTATYDNILQKVSAVRKQMNTYLDEIEKKIRDEADQMKKEDEIELNKSEKEQNEVKAVIEDILKSLQYSNDNMNSLFELSEQAKYKLDRLEKQINEIEQHQQQLRLNYKLSISDEIENIRSAQIPLGCLSRTPNIFTMTATYNRRLKATKGRKDKTNCFINDCKILFPDRLVVIDRDLGKVKLIDTRNNTLISTYIPPSSPWGVTAYRAGLIIAITLPESGAIQMLTVASEFTLLHHIKVKDDCRGIAYKDGKFAVSYVNPGSVDIIDGDGKILHTIRPQEDDECMLQYPCYITFGPDKDTVIVSDLCTHTVSVVTFSGQILRTYTHGALRSPCGLTITTDGLLLICSWDGKCIHIVSPDFNASKILINQDDHVLCPRSLTFCENSQTLYVSNARYDGGEINSQIQVYDVKVPV